VQYPEDDMRKLIELVRQRDPRLSAEDRIGLLDDSFQLAYAGFYPATLPFELVSAMVEEDEPWVLFTMQHNLTEYVGRNHSQEAICSGVATLLRHLFGQRPTVLGFDPKPEDGPLDPLAREVCVCAALAGNHPRQVPLMCEAYTC
jgi:hypothetical protein